MKNMVLGCIFILIFLEVITMNDYNFRIIDVSICCF